MSFSFSFSFPFPFPFESSFYSFSCTWFVVAIHSQFVPTLILFFAIFSLPRLFFFLSQSSFCVFSFFVFFVFFIWHAIFDFDSFFRFCSLFKLDCTEWDQLLHFNYFSLLSSSFVGFEFGFGIGWILRFCFFYRKLDSCRAVEIEIHFKNSFNFIFCIFSRFLIRNYFP